MKLKSRTILGIIFIILALFSLRAFSAAMSREDGYTTKTMNQIDQAVVLLNGKLDEANEGKPVIVRGRLHTEKEAYDEELDLTFNSPHVERSTEVIGQDGKWTKEEDSTVAFYGTATLGEFKLSRDFLRDIKLTRGYTSFTETELGDLTVKGDYIYESDDVRYLYSYIPDRKELGLVGTQEGQTLEEIPGIECVHEGSVSKSELKTNEDQYNIPYIAISAALSALFIILACWMFGFFSRRKEENWDYLPDDHDTCYQDGENSGGYWIPRQRKKKNPQPAENKKRRRRPDRDHAAPERRRQAGRRR